MSHELNKFSSTALLIDGVHCDEHLVLAAVAVDEQCDKHLLGLREGVTEDATACKALLADLIERGPKSGTSPYLYAPAFGAATSWRMMASRSGISALPRPKELNHTARYTALAPDPLRRFWRDC